MMKTKMKSALMAFLTVAMIACIALGYALTTNAAFFAKAAEQQKAEQNVATNVTVSAEAPADVTLTGYAAGQYYLTVSVKNEDLPDTFYSEFAVTVNKGADDAEDYYLTYNSDTKVAAGVIKTTTDNAEIELSVTTSTVLTVDVAIDNLFIGPAIENSLGVVEISQTPLTIQLKDIQSGNYDVVLELAVERIEETPITIVAYDAEGKTTSYTRSRLEINTDSNEIISYVFTEVELVDGEYFTITSGEALDVTVTIQNAAPPALPWGTGIQLTPWELVTYSYVAPTSGDYAITYTAPADADVSITFKTDAASYDGLLVQGSNYPLPMTGGTTYYFDIVLAADNNATVTFNIQPWVTPTIGVGEVYYLPATTDGSQEASPLNMEAGTYTLTLTDIPADVIWNEYTIIANIDYVEYTLDLANNFITNVVVAEGSEIYLTTSSPVDITVGVTFSIPEVRHEITAGTSTTVTIPAKGEYDDYGTVTYYLTNPVEGGFYTLTLSDVSAADVVSVVTSEGVAPFINVGGVVGGFRVNYADDFALIFRNSGTTDVTLTALVNNVAGDNAIALKTATTITLQANSSAAKYLEGLAQGNYNLAFSAAAGVSVYEDGVKLNVAENSAVITVDYLQAYNGIVSLVFVNDTAEAVTFTVTVTPQNEMTLDTPVTITAHGYNTVVSYYIDISNGNYAMALKVPEGLSVNVVLGGYEVVSYGNVAGVVTIDVAHEEGDESINPVQGYLSVVFYCYGNDEVDYTLSAVLYSMTGEMTVNEEQTVSLDASKFGATYSIALTAGEYSVNLHEGVTVAVNGVPVGADGKFLITDYSATAYITFINTTNAAVSDYTATVMLEQTHIATLGHGMEVTLVPYEEGIYYIANLTAGASYNITLTGENLANVYIYINGMQVTFDENGVGTFTASDVTAQNIAFYYYGEAENVTFTFTVTAATAE